MSAAAAGSPDAAEGVLSAVAAAAAPSCGPSSPSHSPSLPPDDCLDWHQGFVARLARRRRIRLRRPMYTFLLDQLLPVLLLLLACPFYEGSRPAGRRGAARRMFESEGLENLDFRFRLILY